ncbi:hypothetical protein MKJ04_18635 [Pontibacter sp. E15-1]|uniref:hypothetical protein n=1 Tax=Pontibacter sp. E15-1 TaxID=2919918 RepID=UPI001F4F78D3|nr:hypothetical protein [Pontibacter sp. E15-1]MCJ8166868.1 hypothetical protein [Pontibacter sp. E15-1]
MFSRKNIQMIVTVALLIMAAACSLFKQDVNVPQTFELRLDRPAGAAQQFAVLKDVDTNTEELKKYKGDVESFDINSITYRIEDFKGHSDAVISGNLEFAVSGSSEFTVLDTISDLHLRKMQESGQPNTVVLHDQAVKQKLAMLLQRGSVVTFRLNATTTDSPIAASLIVAIDTKMTVEL